MFTVSHFRCFNIFISPFKFYCKQLFFLNVLSAICVLILFVLPFITYKFKNVLEHHREQQNCLRISSNSCRISYSTKRLSLRATCRGYNCCKRRESKTKNTAQSQQICRICSFSFYVFTLTTEHPCIYFMQAHLD